MVIPNFKDYKQGRTGGLFPLDFNTLIPTTHLVRRIDQVIERINIQKLQGSFSDQGSSAYHPQMMLKVIIYGYATKNYSCRGISALMRQDITYMWLSGMQTPDFNTINRFRSVYLKDAVEDVFTEVLVFLHEHDYIKFEDYFVDGTKLEAEAGKYTHVWKKSSERYKAAVQGRVKELMQEIDRLNKEEDTKYKGMDLPEFGDQSQISSADVERVASLISQRLSQKEEELSKSEVRSLESSINKLNKEKDNLLKYEQQGELLGDRNSYSKTDRMPL